MTEWIKCSERLPDKGTDVLCLSNGKIFHSWWDDVSSSCDWYDIKNTWIIEDVTHWMPIPPLPSECNCPICDKETRKILEKTYWKVDNSEH